MKDRLNYIPSVSIWPLFKRLALALSVMAIVEKSIKDKWDVFVSSPQGVDLGGTGPWSLSIGKHKRLMRWFNKSILA